MQTGADSGLGLSQVLGASGRKQERAGKARPVQRELPKGGRGIARLPSQPLHPP